MRQLFEDPANTKAAIAMLRKGSDEAYLQIYRLYQKECIEWAKKHTSIREVHLKDVFQDAVIVLFKKLATFDHNSTVAGFLKQAFKYKLYHKYREQIRFKLEEEVDDRFFPNGYDQIYSKDNSDHLYYLLRVGLEKLGEPCRRLLKLKFYDNFDGESIAGMMDYKNANVVYTNTLRCIRQLRALVGDKK